MEDEWYSGDNTNTAAAAAAVPGASPPTAGVAGKSFGDSFTPPTSHGGMIGGQVRFSDGTCRFTMLMDSFRGALGWTVATKKGATRSSRTIGYLTFLELDFNVYT